MVNNFNWNDVVTWNKGRHTVRIGGDVLHVQYYQPTNSNFNGTFTFSGKNSGMALPIFFSATPAPPVRSAPSPTTLQHNYGAFIQDDYRSIPTSP